MYIVYACAGLRSIFIMGLDGKYTQNTEKDSVYLFQNNNFLSLLYANRSTMLSNISNYLMLINHVVIDEYKIV